jgi:hypothetical protein
MKKLLFFPIFLGLFLTLFVGSSCTKEEVKLTSCDSLNKSLISNLNRADSLRLVSCLKLTGCDSVSLGILKPTNEIALRLNCIVGIGENFGGGIVFKVDSSFKHGLIMSQSDAAQAQFLDASGAPVGYFDFLIGATSLDDGLSNTNKLIKYSPTGGAALVCATYVSNSGHDDWYLPSKNELIEMSKVPQKDLISFNALKNNGRYWSSTEFSPNGAWVFSFNYSFAPSVVLKVTAANIKPIRKF